MPRPMQIFQTMRLLAADPRSFNDPFEVRPWFDQERHDYAAKSHESFHQHMLGIEHSLIKGQSMAGLPTENASAFGEQLNNRFREDIGRKFRVLCLSSNPKSALMWSHYASSHGGIVIGIDPKTQGFHRGLNPDGCEIRYSTSRTSTKLPLAFYQTPCVEVLDDRGNIINSPDQPVQSDGGLWISFREYRRQIEATSIAALSNKAQDWHYEQEVRFIYDLSQHSTQLVYANGRHFVAIPLEALREIIVGFRASVRLVRDIVGLYREKKLGNPKLFYSGCHPHLYEVQLNETDDQYLLDYFQTVLPCIGL